MKVLFDHNVPSGLRKALIAHVVSFADEMGWAELSNGNLLKAADEAGFEVMLTCDQGIFYQQNLKGRKLGLVVFDTNDWKVIRRNLRHVVETVDAAGPGSFSFVDLQRRAR